MKYHRSYHHKYWFGMMWIVSSRRRMFGHKVIHLTGRNPVLMGMYVNIKPCCWRG